MTILIQVSTVAVVTITLRKATFSPTDYTSAELEYLICFLQGYPFIILFSHETIYYKTEPIYCIILRGFLPLSNVLERDTKAYCSR